MIEALCLRMAALGTHFSFSTRERKLHSRYKMKKNKILARNLACLFVCLVLTVVFLFSGNSNSLESGSDSNVDLPKKTGFKSFISTVTKKPERQKPKEPRMKIETSYGDLYFVFHPLHAPKTVAQIKKAVLEGYFDGCHFYRHAKNFVLQGGCWPFPNAKPQLPPLPLEYKLPNIKYAVSMARGNDPNSGSSEFALMLANNTIVNGERDSNHEWGFSAGYAVFMSLDEGEDVIQNITESTRDIEEWKLNILWKKVSIV